LGRLVEAVALHQRGTLPEAHYTFKQALIQDSAYHALLKSTRQNYHKQIASALEEHFGETAQTQPELVAHHYTEAGLTTQAMSYWQRAGQRAVKHSAHLEAIEHYTAGLKIVETLPESPERNQQELVLLVSSGVPLTATKGFASPELERVFTRARELSQQVGETPQLFPLLRGMAVLYMVRAEFQTAAELGQQLLQLAQNLDDEGCVIEAHLSLGLILLYRGELAASRTHLEQAIAAYRPETHHALAYVYGDDPGVVCLTYVAIVLALQRHLDQARKRSQEAIALAKQVAHPFSLAMTLNFSARLYQCCQDVHTTLALAEETLALSAEHGFAHWITTGSILHGWALTQLGHGEEGIAQLQVGLAGWQRTGAEVALSHFFTMHAEACGQKGQIKAGLDVIDEALAVVEKNGERFFEAEVYRVKGELLLAGSREGQKLKVKGQK
jgi:predicted ATPase